MTRSAGMLDAEPAVARAVLSDDALVMLDRSIFDISPEEIRNVRVLTTFVGGRKVFDRTPPTGSD